MGLLLCSTIHSYAGSEYGEQEQRWSPRSQSILNLIHNNSVAELQRRFGQGLDPNEVFEGGFTMLLWTANSRNTEAARMLIERGAKVDAVLPDGRNTLMLAAQAWNVPLADLFRQL